MSTAAAAVDATPVPAKGKKKLILIVAAALVLLLLAGSAALLLLKSQAAKGDEGEDGETASAPAETRRDPKIIPTFVALEMFTVNLADRDAERYAQIGITLEVDDSKAGERIKQFMPAIRNNVLMAIADRTAAELMGRDGKTQLAERVKRETARALGYDVPEEGAVTTAAKQRGGDDEQPVRGVHFSNFIIQ
ncbi:MAG: flagellar basal body-associated FliL family protein [Rubrivivax sp.]|nr:flagellar basal body-associated FliL family protein [Rubrivivax sp.]